MTLLQDIIDGASGSQVDVATLLRKTKVLAARLRTVELGTWVDLELNGYGSAVEIPGYRGPFRLEVQGHFSGPMQSQYKNAPVPALGFPKRYRDSPLFERDLRQSVSELESLIRDSDGTLRMMWPADVIAMTNQMIDRGEVRLYEYMYLQQAFLVVPATLLLSVVDTVRTRILELALEFESVSPDTGQPEAPVPDRDEVQQIVTNIIGGVTNVAIASHGVRQSIEWPSAGNASELLDFAQANGVGGSLLDDLRDALAADDDGEQQDDEKGRNVRAWLSRYMLHPAGALSAGAGGQLIAQAIAHYLNIA